MHLPEYMRGFYDHGLFINQYGLVNVFSDATKLNSHDQKITITKNVDGFTSDVDEPTEHSINPIYQYL